ncbi:hypothetical protein ACFVX3_28645 [Rhodococcus erythropolis]
MTEIEFIEVDPVTLEPKDVAAQMKSDEERVQDMKKFIQNLFKNSGGAE